VGRSPIPGRFPPGCKFPGRVVGRSAPAILPRLGRLAFPPPMPPMLGRSIAGSVVGVDGLVIPGRVEILPVPGTEGRGLTAGAFAPGRVTMPGVGLATDAGRFATFAPGRVAGPSEGRWTGAWFDAAGRLATALEREGREAAAGLGLETFGREAFAAGRAAGVLVRPIEALATPPRPPRSAATSVSTFHTSTVVPARIKPAAIQNRFFLFMILLLGVANWDSGFTSRVAVVCARSSLGNRTVCRRQQSGPGLSSRTCPSRPVPTQASRNPSAHRA
jgi:hypothetical protein